MKKLVFLTTIMMGASSLCFAQQSQGTTKSASVAQYKTLSGKIESITMADPLKGTKSQIVVDEATGTKKTFIVGALAKLYDSNMNVITLDKLSKDKSVQVEYQTNASGGNDVVSIKVLK